MDKKVKEILDEKVSLERECIELMQINEEMNLPAEAYKMMMLSNIAHSLSVIADTFSKRAEQTERSE